MKIMTRGPFSEGLDYVKECIHLKDGPLLVQKKKERATVPPSAIFQSTLENRWSGWLGPD